LRNENLVYSDKEVIIGIMHDRLRLKKNISTGGNYTLTKVPAGGQAGGNNGQN